MRRLHDRVEAEYVGEPRPPGLIGKLLAPGGGTIEHFDRFIMPCVTEVEYRLGSSSHMLVNTAMTPVSAEKTRMYSAVSFRLPVPHAPIIPLIKPLAIKVLKQDAYILREQTATIARFSGEKYASTDLDALGPQILLLLKQAQRGERTPMEAPAERRFKMAL